MSFFSFVSFETQPSEFRKKEKHERLKLKEKSLVLLLFYHLFILLLDWLGYPMATCFFLLGLVGISHGNVFLWCCLIYHLLYLQPPLPR